MRSIWPLSQGQNNAKAAGLDGVIVLVPQFTSSLNRENSDLSPLSKGTYDNMTFGSSVPGRLAAAGLHHQQIFRY